MTLTYGSVCSGAGTCALAFLPLGVKAAWFAEINPAASAVLAHHWPTRPNLGDMTTLPERILAREIEAPDILMGGTPCQAFSVAGLRNSLDDARGNLTLTFCEIANAIDTVRASDGRHPLVVFWENVPGVLSVEDHAFGCFLGALAGSGAAIDAGNAGWSYAGLVYGPRRTAAWRVLDAQYFGVAQRRRRVFVVAGSGNFDPAKVLFESEGVCRNTPPSREAGKGIAGVAPFGVGECGEVGHCLRSQASKADKHESTTYVVVARRQDPVVACGIGDVLALQDCTGREKSQNGLGISEEGVSYTIDTTGQQGVAHGIGVDCYNGAITGDVAATFGMNSGGTNTAGPKVLDHMAVRRLTPRECERLQGWPDDHTLVPYRGKPMADGPRYKIIGNGWALPCVQWIGRRIINQINETT